MKLIVAAGLIAFMSLTTLPVLADDAFDAGYEWAKENDYTEARDCGSDTNPFNDGCEAWGDEYEKAYDEAISEHYTDSDDCSGTDAEVAGCEAGIAENE